MLPAPVTTAVVQSEMAGVTGWCGRHSGWQVDLDDIGMQLLVTTTHPVTGALVRITADLAGYPAVPPAWRLDSGEPGAPGSNGFPQAGSVVAGAGSIFHPNGVVCAPWNQLAYSENGGPHGDWGALTNWRSAGPGSTRADTLADMLSQLQLHLLASPGTM